MKKMIFIGLMFFISSFMLFGYVGGLIDPVANRIWHTTRANLHNFNSVGCQGSIFFIQINIADFGYSDGTTPDPNLTYWLAIDDTISINDKKTFISLIYLAKALGKKLHFHADDLGTVISGGKRVFRPYLIDIVE